MVIREGDDSIEIVAVERVPDHMPTPGDTRLEVVVTSGGFSGRSSAWVDNDRLCAFVRQLSALLKDRGQGAADLESISPGEFVLRIESVDSLGHIAVSGRLAKRMYAGECGPYLHAVEFGFEFDPTALSEIVATFEAIKEGRP